MGTDWRPYLEKKTENGWVPYWEPSLSSDWYDSLMCNGYFEQASYLLAGTMDKDIADEKMEEYLKSMPLEEVRERFNDNPHVYWHWHEHKSVLKSRDYNWFDTLYDRMDDYRMRIHNSIVRLELPNDVSHRVLMEYECIKGDSGSLGVIMVSDLIAHPSFKNFKKTEWLRTNIENPENARLIFWFC